MEPDNSTTSNDEQVEECALCTGHCGCGNELSKDDYFVAGVTQGIELVAAALEWTDEATIAALRWMRPLVSKPEGNLAELGVLQVVLNIGARVERARNIRATMERKKNVSEPLS